VIDYNYENALRLYRENFCSEEGWKGDIVEVLL
jgi:hypothetical protein